ncbi:RNA polymerase subunit sigma-70 [Streptomyces sp. NPDC052077]|uniref:RNA polymerase subunit sigma-70 n=1 Tax=Streptomyces sp. NPDC052077 TaxID=3154757 RepID=UPI0034235F60
MRARRASRDADRDQEFETFVAGAAGRLLHTATLLTAEPPDDNPHARDLLVRCLAHTYASWDGAHGDDPYDRARLHLAIRFAHTSGPAPGPFGRARREPAGPLAGMTPSERLILVLRIHEGIAEEQTAALLGLPVERIRTVCERTVSRLLHPPPPAAPLRPAARAEAAT